MFSVVVSSARAQSSSQRKPDVSNKALITKATPGIDTKAFKDQSMNAATAKLHKLADDYYAWRNENYPVQSSEAGLHTWDDRLTDYSPAKIEARAKHVRSLLANVRAMKTDDPEIIGARESLRSWPKEERIDWILFRSQLENVDFGDRILKFESTNPQIYTGECTSAIYVAIRQHNVLRRRGAADSRFVHPQFRRDLRSGQRLEVANPFVQELRLLFHDHRRDPLHRLPALVYVGDEQTLRGKRTAGYDDARRRSACRRSGPDSADRLAVHRAQTKHEALGLDNVDVESLLGLVYDHVRHYVSADWLARTGIGDAVALGRIRVEMMLNEVPDRGHLFRRDAHLAGNPSELVLAQLGQMFLDDLPGIRVGDSLVFKVVKLYQQALAQVSRPDTDRVEGLESP